MHFYENIGHVAEYLATLKTQTLAFCEEIKECNEVASAFDTGLVIFSEKLNENPEILEKLVKDEGFEEH